MFFHKCLLSLVLVLFLAVPVSAQSLTVRAGRVMDAGDSPVLTFSFSAQRGHALSSLKRKGGQAFQRAVGAADSVRKRGVFFVQNAKGAAVYSRQRVRGVFNRGR